MVRKYQGRRKIEIVKMINEANLQVTFSKRKSGIFKKASELCTLCDAKIVVIVCSPSGRIFSFGHPNVNVLLDPCSRRILRLTNDTDFAERNTNSKFQMLNKFLTEVTAVKERERRNEDALVQNERINKNPEKWWTNPPGELNLSHSTCMIHVLEDLKKNIDDVTSQFLQTNPNYYVGSSSNVAPSVVNGGDIYTSQDLFDHNRPSRMLPFGYDFMNRTPAGYSSSQIQNQEFGQAHPHHGPRYY